VFASWKGTGELVLRMAFGSARVDGAGSSPLGDTRADSIGPVGVLTEGRPPSFQDVAQPTPIATSPRGVPDAAIAVPTGMERLWPRAVDSE
jgi:hypothetical protein